MSDNTPIPKSDGCHFYFLGQDTTRTGEIRLNVTDRPPQFGVFFDGTGNNLYNDTHDTTGKHAPTNIGKLFTLYPGDSAPFCGAHYIDGIGTANNKPDDGTDMAFGFGVGEKVKEALDRVKVFFRDYPNAPIGLLDVFGFSRGAAEARHFINEVQRLNLIDPDYFGGPRLQIRFLGLFDTVGSIGLPGDNSQSLPGEHFNLNLNPLAVQYVYHLTAFHEQRAYFPLSSILTAPGQSPSPHFVEEVLPGSHSDIGGGYGPAPETVYYPPKQVSWPRQSLYFSHQEPALQAKVRAIKAEYEQRYPAPGLELTVDFHAPWERGLYRYVTLAPCWHRRPRPELAYAALAKMHTRACSQGVPFEALDRLPEKPQFQGRDPEQLYVLPRDLPPRLPILDANPKAEPEADYVYKNYVHHACQFWRPPPENLLSGTAILGINVNKPETNPDRPGPNGIREWYANDPARGDSPLDHWRRRHMGHGSFSWQRE